MYIVQVKAAQMREEFTKDKKNLLRAHNQGGYLLVKRYWCGSNLPHLALCKINIYIFGSENKVWLDAAISS